MSEKTYYEVLWIAEDASPKEIKEAYHQRCQHNHPDHNRETEKTQYYANENMRGIIEAYEVLNDPAKRAEYDRRLAAARRASGRSATNAGAASSKGPGQAAGENARPHTDPGTPRAAQTPPGGSDKRGEAGPTAPPVSGATRDETRRKGFFGGSDAPQSTAEPPLHWLARNRRATGGCLSPVAVAAFLALCGLCLWQYAFIHRDSRHRESRPPKRPSAPVFPRAEKDAQGQGAKWIGISVPDYSDPAQGGWVSYDIERATDVSGAPGTWQTVLRDVPPNQTALDGDGLKPQTRYWYRFVARSDRGGDSSTGVNGVAASVTTEPPPPYWGALAGHTGTVRCVAYSPDGRLVATASLDKTLRLWDAWTGQLVVTLAGHTAGLFSVAFSPDGRTLATGSADETVKLWDVRTGKVTTTLTGFKDGVISVAFSPNGRALATGSADAVLKIWDVRTWRLQRTITDSDGSHMSCMTFSPDGRRLAAAGDEGMLKIWDVRTGGLYRKLEARWDVDSQYTSVAFSPDGQTLASGSLTSAAELWDVATAERRAGLSGDMGQVHSVAFSPDGKTVACGADWGQVMLWDVVSRSTRTTGGTRPVVASVAFSPDGSTLAAAFEGGEVRLLDATQTEPWDGSYNPLN